jgi:hypothetical protein
MPRASECYIIFYHHPFHLIVSIHSHSFIFHYGIQYDFHLSCELVKHRIRKKHEMKRRKENKNKKQKRFLQLTVINFSSLIFLSHLLLLTRSLALYVVFVLSSPRCRRRKALSSDQFKTFWDKKSISGAKFKISLMKQLAVVFCIDRAFSHFRVLRCAHPRVDEINWDNYIISAVNTYLY